MAGGSSHDGFYVANYWGVAGASGTPHLKRENERLLVMAFELLGALHPAPVFFVGDMNTEFNQSPPLRAMSRSAAWHNLAHTFHRADTTYRRTDDANWVATGKGITTIDMMTLFSKVGTPRRWTLHQ